MDPLHQSSRPAMTESLSVCIYRMLLHLYPEDFRQQYGVAMVQVFRDCYRAKRTAKKALGVLKLWLQIFPDLLQTIPAEHFHQRKGKSLMNNWQRQTGAVLGCLVVIAFALFLLRYGRGHEVPTILAFGHLLDAVATVGILGNAVV